MIHVIDTSHGAEITSDMYNKLIDNSINSAEAVHPQYSNISSQLHELQVGASGETQLFVKKRDTDIVFTYTGDMYDCLDFLLFPAHMIGRRFKLYFREQSRSFISTGSYTARIWNHTAETYALEMEDSLSVLGLDHVSPDFTITEPCVLTFGLFDLDLTGVIDASTDFRFYNILLEETT
jgi:hypothetical protein